MKLRFAVNQAECLKRGIDAPKSIVTVEVTPAEIPQNVRNWIAKRMDGIDVCELSEDGEKLYHPQNEAEGQRGDEARGYLIQANEPTMAGLLMAIMQNEAQLKTLSPEQKAGLRQGIALLEACFEVEALYKALRDDAEKAEKSSTAHYKGK